MLVNQLGSFRMSEILFFDMCNTYKVRFFSRPMSREGYLSLAELQYFLIECSDKHLTEPHEQLKQSSLWFFFKITIYKYDQS